MDNGMCEETEGEENNKDNNQESEYQRKSKSI